MQGPQGFERKLLIGVLAILLVLVPALAANLFSLREVAAASRNLLTQYAESLILARDLQRPIAQQRAAIPLYVLTRDAEALEQFRSAQREFSSMLARLRAMGLDPESRAMLDRIEEKQREASALAQPGIDLRQKGASAERTNAYFRRTAGPASRNLGEALDRFEKHITRVYVKERAQEDTTTKRIFIFLAVISSFAILFCVAIALLLRRLVREKNNQDLAQARLAEKERALSRARKETVEIVAHDLKNPLASITLNTQAALARLGEESPGRRGLEASLRSAATMRRLIDDLLDHAKIEAGSLELNLKRQSPEPILREVAARFEPLAANKKLRMTYAAAANLPPLAIDRDRLDQVLSNFLGNAIKFTPAGGEILLRAERRAGMLHLSVSDTGPGMSKDQAAHVFERYWQARGTAHQGTGLGLAIAKSIVQAHGGQVGVESEAGRGSVFFATLPCAPGGAAPLSP